jgi:hypothetical protein
LLLLLLLLLLPLLLLMMLPLLLLMLMPLLMLLMLMLLGLLLLLLMLLSSLQGPSPSALSSMTASTQNGPDVAAPAAVEPTGCWLRRCRSRICRCTFTCASICRSTTSKRAASLAATHRVLCIDISPTTRDCTAPSAEVDVTTCASDL